MGTIAEYLDKRIKGKRSHNTRSDTPERLKTEREKEAREERIAIKRLAKHLNADEARLGELLKDAIDELNSE